MGYSKLVRQKQLRKALLQLFFLAAIDYDYKRSDTSLCSTISWNRIGSLRQFRWFALTCIFGLYFKYFINLKTLTLGVAMLRLPPELRAWWQPHSDCRVQNSAGIIDWAKFMCTPIGKFKLSNTIFNNHDNSVYIDILYTVSTDNPVMTFIFLIYALALW